ncbi:MAG: hypothetical protein KatS3mg085_070 [Candidatus Dojkabacteria bacterium]|nr:MAG: hypothetical protein KatS3mg085_070 [Candidatus Dojkabacteria bacterium]
MAKSLQDAFDGSRVGVQFRKIGEDQGRMITNSRNGTVYSGKLYQRVKGWDGRIWVRSYDEISATNWYHTGGSVPGSSNIGVFNSKLFQVVKGWSGKIYFRFGTSENNLSNWEYLPNSFVVGETDFIKLNDKILVSARGTNGSIFLGYITEGQERYFLTLDGETPGEIDLIEFNSEPYITVVGKSRKIFTRNLPN